VGVEEKEREEGSVKGTREGKDVRKTKERTVSALGNGEKDASRVYR
jgi:hypothetical protein